MSLRILSAGSTLHGVRACAALAPPDAFEIATDHGHNIIEAVKRGDASADIVLLPADMIDTLASLGLVGGKAMLGTVGIGGVIREGSRVPDILTMENLRAALHEADAVLLTRAPTGDHLLDVIARLGLTDAVTRKLARFDTSTKLNVALTERPDNALGFGPETEIRAGKGVQWIGDVPDDIQIALPYAAAMLTTTSEQDAAARFLAFLESAQAHAAFAKTGLRF